MRLKSTAISAMLLSLSKALRQEASTSMPRLRHLVQRSQSTHGNSARYRRSSLRSKQSNAKICPLDAATFGDGRVAGAVAAIETAMAEAGDARPRVTALFGTSCRTHEKTGRCSRMRITQSGKRAFNFFPQRNSFSTSRAIKKPATGGRPMTGDFFVDVALRRCLHEVD